MTKSNEKQIDPDRLEAFVDAVAETLLENPGIPGATVAVTDRYGPLLIKGYGFANTDTREEVVGDHHLFRIASITKTFTATAIMQLVEQGKLSLDDNIRQHLGDLQIDDHLGVITIAHLLTHTPGFEDRVLGYFGAPNPRDGDTTKAELEAIGAHQVRPPGEAISYSNYGYALLGEIIAQVSGESYADYIRNHILLPLDMNSSDVRVKTVTGEDEYLPWLPDLRAREAKAHSWSSGWWEPTTWPLARDTTHAEGSMSSTAADMAAYMRMHLNRGTLDGATILQESTWETMSQPLFWHSDPARANAHGFWTKHYSGYDVLEHGGSVNGFKSIMSLVPELGLGIFVSTNAGAGSALRTLPRRIVQEFFPEPVTLLPAPPADFAERAQRYTGEFLDTRRTEKRFEKLRSSYRTVGVSSTAEGYLVVSSKGKSKKYVEIGDDTFKSLVDGSVIQFAGDHGDRAQWLYMGSSGAYERPTLLEQRLTLFVPVGLGLLSGIAVLAILVRRIWQRALPLLGTQYKISVGLVGAAAASWLVVVASFSYATGQYVSGPTSAFNLWPSAAMRGTLYLLILATLLSLAGAAATFVAWRSGRSADQTLAICTRAASCFFLIMIVALYAWNVYRIAG